MSSRIRSSKTTDLSLLAQLQLLMMYSGRSSIYMVRARSFLSLCLPHSQIGLYAHVAPSFTFQSWWILYRNTAIGIAAPHLTVCDIDVASIPQSWCYDDSFLWHGKRRVIWMSWRSEDAYIHVTPPQCSMLSPFINFSNSNEDSSFYFNLSQCRDVFVPTV